MIHQYQLNGYQIVVDPASGSIHSVDPLAYEMIALYPSQPKEELLALLNAKYQAQISEQELAELYEQITALVEAKQLYTPDSFQDLTLTLPQQPVLKALCLHVAHVCNLNCHYCFASQGKYQGERALMSWEVGKQAIDFLLANSGDRYHLEVDFFGGEPLMNWPVVKQIVAYAREQEAKFNKHFRFTLTTNGLLLDDEVSAFCNREIDNVVLSLDGRPEVHDRLRQDYNGQGSYALIVPKFQKFVADRGDKSYYIRGTFTHYNLDFTNDIFHLADLGFRELSMEPVVCAPDDPYALTEEDLPLVLEQYEILAQEMLHRQHQGRGFSFYHYLLDLTHGPCIHKRIAGCGSGSEYLAVTPWGELFPCHQFVSDPQYSMGDIWQGLSNQELYQQFRDCNVYARPECQQCWARLYCSGGCAANAYHANGDILGIYEYGCQLFKKRLECAIMMQVALSEEQEADHANANL